MTNEQMELELAAANRCPGAARRDSRLTRATWWFDQMRQVVDRAFEWPAAPRLQPEQIWLGDGSQRPASQ